MKKLYFLLLLVLTVTKITFSQVSNSGGNREITVSASGFEKDDRSLIEFFKKNRIWTQTTKANSITIEFLGFEIENSEVKPFAFGKRKESESNILTGAAFHKNDGYGLAKKIYFNYNGVANWSTGSSNSTVNGTYNYDFAKNEVYLTMPNAKTQTFDIIKGQGKNLGITGEAVENIKLRDRETGEVYTKQSNNDDEGLWKKPEDLSWLLPENRFLIKYKLIHDRYMMENGRIITKKNQVEEKYAFIRKFTILERDIPGGLRDYQGTTLSNTDLAWKTVEIDVITGVGDGPYIPGTSFEQLARSYSESKIFGTTLRLITWGEKRKEDEVFQNSNKNRLYINTALNRAGWDSKEGSIETASGQTMTYNLSENYYLSPASSTKNTDELSFGTEIDANCIMTFQQAMDVKEGVKLSSMISNDVYNLEMNSLITADKLRDRVYKFSLESKKMLGFGKSKFRKGTWSFSATNKTIVFKFEDGQRLEYLVTQIRDGYIYQFKDSSGVIYGLSNVVKK